MKMPTRKHINKMVDEYEKKLTNEFIGRNMKISIDDAQQDYKSGLLDMIKAIKDINKPKSLKQ
jgi:hypothetical protein